MEQQLTFRRILRANANTFRDRRALRSPDGHWLDYDGLDTVTTAVAGRLAGILGGGATVAWMAHNSVWYYIMYFATAKAQLRFCPLNYWLRPQELAPQLSLLQPHLCIYEPPFGSTIHTALTLATLQDPPRLLKLSFEEEFHDIEVALAESLSDSEMTRPLPPDEESAPHEILFTSGTTGQAKGVMRTQRSRILTGMRRILSSNMSRHDHQLFFGPQFHAGSIAGPVSLIVCGGRATVLRRFDATEIDVALNQEHITLFGGVAAFFRRFFAEGYPSGPGSLNVRTCFFGASVTPPPLMSEIKSRFPNATLVHLYGTTESGDAMALVGDDVERHPRAIGNPVLGAEARVVDALGGDLGEDEVGELWVRSEGVMSGYLGRPDLTSEVITDDGWLKTGDLATFRSDSGYYHLMDRARDMIITGGENVYSQEVEDVIALLPAVEEVAVIGVPDDMYEERVVAIVKAADELEAAEVSAWVRSRLAGYKVPKEVFLVEDFPRTPLGKIEKAHLRSIYGSVFDQP